MNDYLAMAINIAYLVAAYMILRKLQFSFIVFGTWTASWATLFIGSIFFTIGLLLFDVPLGFWGGNNPHSIQRMKEDWWFFPLGFFILFLISLGLKTLIERKRNGAGRKPSGHMRR